MTTSRPDVLAEGYNVFDTSDDVLTLFGRVDWNINDAHRFSIRNNYLKHDNLNEAFDLVLHWQGRGVEGSVSLQEKGEMIRG